MELQNRTQRVAIGRSEDESDVGNHNAEGRNRVGDIMKDAGGRRLVAQLVFIALKSEPLRILNEDEFAR